jgi:hypothetical protein
MMLKLTNRSILKTSDWLSQSIQTDWSQVMPPPQEGLKIQQIDITANLNSGLVVQQLKDAFQLVVQSAGQTPSEADRVGSDGQMAAATHKALAGLTRREASDADLWAHLATFGIPQYVRWRWTTDKPAPMWGRFAGSKVRNAIARLWWWAEVTCDHDKPIGDPQRYAVTKNVRDRQTMMMWFVDCAFSGHSGIATSLCGIQETQSLSDAGQRRICRSVNRLARVVCLDSLQSPAETETLCERALHVSQLLRT